MDIYSLGVLLLEILLNEDFYFLNDKDEDMKENMNEKIEDDLVNADCCNEFQNLLRNGVLTEDPVKRINLSYFKDFFNVYFNNYFYIYCFLGN